MTGDVLVVTDTGRGSLSGVSALTALTRGLPTQSIVVPGDSWPSWTRALRRTSAVVLTGNLMAQSGTQLRRALALATSARLTGRTVCAVGAAVSGRVDRTAGVMLRGLARQADLMVVRDDATAHALIGLGVPAPMRVGADPAWTLFDGVATGNGDTGRGPVVIVASSPPPWAESLLPGSMVEPAGADLVALKQRLRDARLVISHDFHVTVAAAAAGTPVLSVVADRSTQLMAERLRQPWVSPTASLRDIAHALEWASSAPAPARAVVQAEIAAADETLALLRLVLSGGAMAAEDVAGLRLEPAW